jgi:hypothetical protein
MTRPCGRTLYRVACIVALLATLPSQACANSINIVAPVLPINFFLAAAVTLLLEASVIRIGLKIRFYPAMGLALSANMVSLAAGAPLTIINAGVYIVMLPMNLPAFHGMCPVAAVTGIAIYFAATVAIEHYMIVAWRRKQKGRASRRRVFLSVLLANAITYAPVAPLFYMEIMPEHDITEFTNRSDWAVQPPTVLYYLDPKGNICSIKTDGEDQQTLVSASTLDYRIMPKGGVVFYQTSDNERRVFRIPDGKNVSCGKFDRHSTLDQTACSPRGKTAAWLTPGPEAHSRELVLYDIDSGRKKKTGHVFKGRPAALRLFWSQSRPYLFVERANRIDTVTIEPDMSSKCEQLDTTNIALAEVYAPQPPPGPHRIETYEDSGESTGLYRGTRPLRLVGEFGLTKEYYRISGFLEFDGPIITDSYVLDTARELVFSDGFAIYLMDTKERKVGWIANGWRVMPQQKAYRHTMTASEYQIKPPEPRAPMIGERQ